jgi:hypothetical protein
MLHVIQFNTIISFNSIHSIPNRHNLSQLFERAVSAKAISNMEVPRWRANQDKMAERLASRAADTLRLHSLQRVETKRARVTVERDLPDPQKVEVENWCCLCGAHWGLAP